MSEELTYYCPRGCNVFTTAQISPECAACGSTMTTDHRSFERVRESIEEQRIQTIVYNHALDQLVQLFVLCDEHDIDIHLLFERAWSIHDPQPDVEESG